MQPVDSRQRPGWTADPVLRNRRKVQPATNARLLPATPIANESAFVCFQPGQTVVGGRWVRLSWRRLFPTLLSGQILWAGSLVALDYFVARFIPDIARGLNVLPV